MNEKDSSAQHRSYFALDYIVGESAWAEQMRRRAMQVGSYRSTVLIKGPSGSGKTLLARAIHEHSNRRSSPFVPVDCGDISPHFFDVQCFGSCNPESLGWFRSADGGTILIDNVDQLDLASQRKLEDVLRRRDVTPEGGPPVRFDARVIATTGSDVEAAVRDGKFYFDLYSRLNKLVLTTISLATRQQDIAHLAAHFVAKSTFEQGLPTKSLSPEAIATLEGMRWPGNVRQLQDTIDDAVANCGGERISAHDLMIDPTGRVGCEEQQWQTLAEVEARHIRDTLTIVDGDLYQAAQVLGVHVTHLRQKIRQHNIESPIN